MDAQENPFFLSDRPEINRLSLLLLSPMPRFERNYAVLTVFMLRIVPGLLPLNGHFVLIYSDEERPAKRENVLET